MSDVGAIFVLGSFVAANVAYVDHLPMPGESLAATGFSLEPGGKGFNVAIATRRLGAHVDGLLPIGNDLFADLAKAAVERAGLPATILRRYERPSGSGVGFVDREGENCLAVYAGANGAITRSDIVARRESIASAAVTFAQFEISDEPILEAFAIASSARRTTVLNPSPFRPIAPAIMAETSVLILNAVEARSCARDLGFALDQTENDKSYRAFADRLFAFGIKTVVVTRGALGALLFHANHSTEVHQAFPVEAIDTLGAGDAFAAGILVGLAQARPWTAIMRLACGCGALTASRRGVVDALPTLDDVSVLIGMEQKAHAI